MMGSMWERGPDGQIRRAPAGEPARSPGVSSSSPWRSLGRGLRGAYDYLGCTLLLSLLWCVIAGAAAMGGWSLGLSLQGPRGRELVAWLIQGAHASAPGAERGDLGRLVL